MVAAIRPTNSAIIEVNIVIEFQDLSNGISDIVLRADAIIFIIIPKESITTEPANDFLALPVSNLVAAIRPTSSPTITVNIPIDDHALAVSIFDIIDNDDAIISNTAPKVAIIPIERIDDAPTRFVAAIRPTSSPIITVNIPTEFQAFPTSILDTVSNALDINIRVAPNDINMADDFKDASPTNLVAAISPTKSAITIVIAPILFHKDSGSIFDISIIAEESIFNAIDKTVIGKAAASTPFKSSLDIIATKAAISPVTIPKTIEASYILSVSILARLVKEFTTLAIDPINAAAD